MLIFIAVVMSVCAVYVMDDYDASDEALAVISYPASGITVTDKGEYIVFSPQEAKCGIIFYPGGKVEAESYAPLMEAFAGEGIMSVLVRMPFNLAVLDVKAADGIADEYAGIENWYMAGHSLGGSMAAAYISEHADEFDGLILLGSYSTEDISGSSLKVLSIYGENDGVMNVEKYKECIQNLPDTYEEVIIEGGNHAYFGSYGIQDGDGSAQISVSDQIYFAAEKIKEFVLK